MVATVNMSTNVPPSREVRIVLPPDVPLGPAEITVVVCSHAPAPVRTLGDLARSAFVGLWRDRTDIADSATFAHELRAKAWSREQ